MGGSKGWGGRDREAGNGIDDSEGQMQTDKEQLGRRKERCN